MVFQKEIILNLYPRGFHIVTNEIVDGQQSAVWLEAFNRIHVQKSIIEWCLK